MKQILLIYFIGCSFLLHAQFTDERVIYQGMGQKKDVITADLDNDGDRDILVATEVGLVWHSNDGEGNFSKNKLISLQATKSIALADLDKDNDLDIVAVGFANVATTMVWYKNDGAANFSAPIIIRSGVFRGWVYTADVDKDENVDIILFNESGSSAISWYKNDGLANFTPTTLMAGFGASQIKGSPLSIADFDGDGDVDIATISTYIAVITLFKNDGQGGFSEPVVIGSTIGDANFIFNADVDKDGTPEIFTTDHSNNILQFKKDVTGDWQSTSIIVNTPYDLVALQIEDFDKDGNKDILVSSFDQNSQLRDEIKFLKNQGDNTFANPIIISQNWGGLALAAGDFTGDDVPDAVSIYFDRTFLHENDGLGNFMERVNIANGGIFYHHSVDIDGDGDLDVLLSLFLDEELVWCRNDGVGNFSAPIVIKHKIGSSYLQSTDFDDDADQDIVAFSGDKLTLFYNNGQGLFSDSSLSTAVAGFPQVYSPDRPSLLIVDVDGDKKKDILLTVGYANEKIIWYKNDGSGHFGNAAFLFEFQSSRRNPIDAADLDGDNLDDLVMSEVNGIKWFKNSGNSAFAQAGIIANAPNNFQRAFTADVDKDGDADILHSFNNNLVWYKNDGNGNFSAALPLLSGNDFFNVHATFADLDKDNDNDFITSGTARLKGWFENNGEAQFLSRDTFYLRSIDATVSIGDVDQDNDLDVIMNNTIDKLVWFGNTIQTTASTSTLSSTIEAKYYPNPFQDELHIELNASARPPYHLLVSDVTGRIVRQEQVISHHHILHWNILPSGLYFIKVTTQHGSIITTGKVIRR